jgi:hypothetical protein
MEYKQYKNYCIKRDVTYHVKSWIFEFEVERAPQKMALTGISDSILRKQDRSCRDPSTFRSPWENEILNLQQSRMYTGLFKQVLTTVSKIVPKKSLSPGPGQTQTCTPLRMSVFWTNVVTVIFMHLSIITTMGLGSVPWITYIALQHTIIAIVVVVDYVKLSYFVWLEITQDCDLKIHSHSRSLCFHLRYLLLINPIVCIVFIFLHTLIT